MELKLKLIGNLTNKQLIPKYDLLAIEFGHYLRLLKVSRC